jgi:uncharacterized protein involved in outer membrane biogenesis
MSTGKKVALGLVIAVIVVVAGLAVIIPMLLDVDRYRPQVTAHIEQETGKPARIGHLGLTVLPQVAIRVDDFALGNPPGFPSGDFVKARRIYAVVDVSALLHHQVVVNSLKLDDPAINLMSDVHGKWNFENPPAKSPASAEPPGDEKASFTMGVISKVTIEGAQLVATNLLASGVPGPAFMEVHGASLDLRQVDLNAFTTASLGARAAPPDAFAALAGGLSSVVYAAAPQAPLAAQGTLKADSLKFGALGVTKVKSKVRLYPKQVFFDNLDMNCYGGKATGNLSLNFAGENLRYSTDARLKGVNVAQFLNAFPEARGMMTGTAEGSAKLSGEVTHSPDPLAGIRGAGQISVRDGELPSLQLNRNLRLLARLANLGPANGDPSSFSSISTDFTIAERRLTNSKIVLVGNGVDVDGSGSMTMGGEGSLDYQGVAKIAAGANPLTNVLAGVSGATLAEGKLTFPFTVGGTFAHPKFSVKGGGAPGAAGVAKGVAEGVAQGKQQPVETIRGIAGMFKKKKQQ